MNNRWLQELWRLADGYPREQGEERDGVFGSIGLFLDRSLERCGYNSTPANTRVFAGTGGDGVHYSFLVSDDGIVRDDCPVVMSVPSHTRTSCALRAGRREAPLHDFRRLAPAPSSD